MKNMQRKYVELLGIPIDQILLPELLERVNYSIAAARKIKIMYANIHTMNLSFSDLDHRRALCSADMVYCDGEGVRWGARLQGKFLPQRMTGADWIYDLCEMCAGKGYSLCLLGGKAGSAEKAAKKLGKKFLGLKVAGTYHGYFEKHGEENKKVIALINEKAPDILLVGFGSPLQEKWINENFEKLNSCVVWAVGALADFVAERVPRGPRWMLDNGLEWLFRLSIEPRKMWKRYVFGNFVFFERIMRERLLKRIGWPGAD